MKVLSRMYRVALLSRYLFSLLAILVAMCMLFSGGTQAAYIVDAGADNTAGGGAGVSSNQRLYSHLTVRFRAAGVSRWHQTLSRQEVFS